MWETRVQTLGGEESWDLQVSEAGKSQNNSPMKVDFESKCKLT